MAAASERIIWQSCRRRTKGIHLKTKNPGTKQDGRPGSEGEEPDVDVTSSRVTLWAEPARKVCEGVFAPFCCFHGDSSKDVESSSGP